MPGLFIERYFLKSHKDYLDKNKDILKSYDKFERKKTNIQSEPNSQLIC